MEVQVDESNFENKWRAWWLVALMATSFGIGELSHFVLGSTSRDMAQELQYGDQSCLLNNTGTGEITCADYTTEIECNSVANGTCQWNYNGQGIEYQVLAGPSFVFAKSIGGLVIGALADRYNRVLILALSTFFFSACTILMGISQELWQLIVLRMGIAFGEAACQVVPVSLVPAIFPKSFHGAALGIVNWGIYFGYGLSYVVGNYVPDLDILGQGWRWCYHLSGIPGFLVGILLLLTTSDPKKHSSSSSETDLKIEEKSTEDVNSDAVSDSKLSFWTRLWLKVKHFFQPAILILLLGACIRQTAGLSWSYNTQPFYNTYYPTTNIGLWLFGDSIIGGSAGIVIGGIVSDQVVKKVGLPARAWVLSGSQLLAAPFAVGVLLAPPPYSFLCLLGAYFFAETWFGILFAILVELVPADVRSFTVGVFLFIMVNVGGNLPVIVDPLGDLLELRTILLILYPGGYLLSAVVFVITGFSLLKYVRRNAE